LEFLPEHIDQYACIHTESESGLLAKINRETHAQVMKPRMLSGHMQGRILSMFSHMIKPQNILEIGTYTGYSALCLAEGMQKNGKLITLDINEELYTRVQGYFDESAYASQIDYRIGNAVTMIPTLQERFDLVFIDADKLNYGVYYDLIFDKVNTGGFIIFDNVLWSGKVAEPIKDNDKDTLYLDELNKRLHQDTRVQNVLMAVRDGLMVLRKLT
jgi:caffeoyl-CoA O-methyltransferase